jgi:hypothetical protein
MPADQNSWIERERERTVDYSREQRMEHLGVGMYPAFHV